MRAKNICAMKRLIKIINEEPPIIPSYIERDIEDLLKEYAYMVRYVKEFDKWFNEFNHFRNKMNQERQRV
jgi:hypothetical protein